MCPWIVLLFIGLFDFGVYTYAAISVQNAARAAVLATGSAPSAAGSSVLACRYAREELKFMINYDTLPTDCSALPLQVQAWSEIDAQGAQMSRVQVRYQPATIFSTYIGAGPFSRTARMRVFGE